MTAVQHPQAPQQPNEPHNPQSSNGFAVSALVIGIVALVMSPMPILNQLGILIALAGIGLAITGIVMASKRQQRAIMAAVGLGLSVLAIFASVKFTNHYVDSVNRAVSGAAPSVSGSVSGSAGSDTPAGPKTYTLMVDGTAKNARVDYSLDGSSGGGITVKVPWSKKMTTTEQSFNYATVSASTEMGTPGNVTCTILDNDGNVVSKKTAESQGGEYGSASVNCSG